MYITTYKKLIHVVNICVCVYVIFIEGNKLFNNTSTYFKILWMVKRDLTVSFTPDKKCTNWYSARVHDAVIKTITIKLNFLSATNPFPFRYFLYQHKPTNYLNGFEENKKGLTMYQWFLCALFHPPAQCWNGLIPYDVDMDILMNNLSYLEFLNKQWICNFRICAI